MCLRLDELETEFDIRNVDNPARAAVAQCIVIGKKSGSNHDIGKILDKHSRSLTWLITFLRATKFKVAYFRIQSRLSCVVSSWWNYLRVRFVFHLFPSKLINLISRGSAQVQSEGGRHTLWLKPTKELDGSLVSCLLTSTTYVLSSSKSFSLSVNYFPTQIKMTLLNGFKLGPNWLVQGQASSKPELG